MNSGETISAYLENKTVTSSRVCIRYSSWRILYRNQSLMANSLLFPLSFISHKKQSVQHTLLVRLSIIAEKSLPNQRNIHLFSNTKKNERIFSTTARAVRLPLLFGFTQQLTIVKLSILNSLIIFKNTEPSSIRDNLNKNLIILKYCTVQIPTDKP